MTTNKIISYITICWVILIIGIPSFYKVINTHNDKLMKVSDKYVIENAYKCIYESKCKENKITLGTLYDLGYITKDIINPITKTVYSKESYVLITKDDAKFYELN